MSAGTAYCADTEIVLPESAPDMLWSDSALWSAGVPTKDDTALINISDATNSLLIDSAAEVVRLDLDGAASLVIGAGGSLETFGRPASEGVARVYGDVALNGTSTLYIRDGGSLKMENGMSVHLASGATFDMSGEGSFYTGQFYNANGKILISDGAVWNATGAIGNANGNFDARVVDSTIKLASHFKMGDGETDTRRKVLTLENSQFIGNASTSAGNAFGVNFAGEVNILDGSSVSEVVHFNLGAESGKTSGTNITTVRGTAEKVSSIQASNGWINSNAGTLVKMVLDGYSSIDWGSINCGTAFDGGEVAVVFQNSNNSFNVSGTAGWGDSKASDVSFTGASSGSWLMSVAEGATNNTFTAGKFSIRPSHMLGSSFSAGVDWSGAGNVFTVNGRLNLVGSMAPDSDVNMFFTLRDGAEMSVSKEIEVGNIREDWYADTATGGASGTYAFTVKDGARLLKETGDINIYNSYYAGFAEDYTASFLVDNAYVSVGSGNIHVGRSRFDSTEGTAFGGTASLEIRNGSEFVQNSNLKLHMSNDEYSEAVAKVVVDSASYVGQGELMMIYEDTVAGGRASVEITGKNSVFSTANKGFWWGHNSTITGGESRFIVSGEGHEITFGGAYGSFNIASSTTEQTGGVLEASITGSGHKFTANEINIGKSNSTGGTNSFYVKSDSASAKNQILLSSGYNINLSGSLDASSTVENSFTMAGNTVLIRTSGETVNLNIGNGVFAGGTAKFVVSGSGNEVNGHRLTLGNEQSTGGQAIMRIEGSGSTINFISDAYFSGGAGTSVDNVIGGKLEFVFGSDGVSHIDVAGRMLTFSGVLEADFSGLAGTFDREEFLIVSAMDTYEAAFNSWVEKNLYDFKLRDDSDTVEFKYDKGDLYLVYTSSVPEPAAFAAVFGAVALLLAARRRRA